VTAPSPDRGGGVTSSRERRRDQVRRGAGLLALGALLGGGLWWWHRRDERRPESASAAAAFDARPGLSATAAPAPPRVGLGGVVVDGRGQPIAGVTVELTSPAASGAAAVDVRAREVTGPDGRFAFANLVEGVFGAVLDGPGVFSLELADVRAPSDDLRLVLARKVELRGRVVDGTRPLPGAHVAARSDELGATLEVAVDAQGAFVFPELPEGSYQVWAWDSELGSRAVAVPLLGAGPFAPLELVVEPAAVVIGRVVERGADVGVVAQVELRPAGTGDEPPRYVRTASDGTFRVDGVPRGRWQLDAYSPGYVAVGALEFEAGRGVLALELAPGGVIEGTVVDERGIAIAGAEVSAHGLTSSGEPSSVRGELSESIARDRLRRTAGLSIAAAPLPSGLGGSAGTAWAGDPLFEPRGELGVLHGPIPMPPIGGPGAAGTVSWSAAPAASTPSGLHGPRVVARGGPALAEPAPLPLPGPPPIWRTGADGRFRIVGLARGLTTVLASAPGMAPGQSDPVKVELGRASTEVEVTMPTGVFVVGTVRDAAGAVVPGALVSVVPAFPGKPQAMVTDALGMYRLGPAAGELRVRASALGFGDAMRVVVAGATLDGTGEPLAGTTIPSAGVGELVVDLVLTAADGRVLGEVVDEGGLPLRGARVVVVDGPGAGRSALVGDAGYALERLPAGPLRVRVEHPDYPSLEATLSATASGEVSPRLMLRPGGGVSGFVLDRHTGAGLPGLALRLSAPGQPAVELVTGLGGTFSHQPLAPARWRLAVDSPGYVPVSLDVDVPAATRAGQVSRSDVRLELERGALLGGQVRDHTGARLAGATVLVRGPGGEASTVTDTAGTFRMVDVPTGRLTLTVSHGGKRGQVIEEVRPGDERLAIVIDVR
jgi:hypothetical protein